MENKTTDELEALRHEAEEKIDKIIHQLETAEFDGRHQSERLWYLKAKHSLRGARRALTWINREIKKRRIRDSNMALIFMQVANERLSPHEYDEILCKAREVSKNQQIPKPEENQ